MSYIGDEKVEVPSLNPDCSSECTATVRGILAKTTEVKKRWCRHKTTRAQETHT